MKNLVSIILLICLMASPAMAESYVSLTRYTGELASTPDNQDNLSWKGTIRVEKLEPKWEAARFWIEVDTFIEGKGFQKTGSGFTPSSVEYSLGVIVPFEWGSLELGHKCWHRIDRAVGEEDKNQQGSWVGVKFTLPIK